MSLHRLCAELGVHTHFHDGLGRHVVVSEETLVRVCRARGAPLERAEDAEEALRVVRREAARQAIPPVVVAWDGHLDPVTVTGADPRGAVLTLEDGGRAELHVDGDTIRPAHPLPPGYHGLTVDGPAGPERCTVIAAPVQAWRPPEGNGAWGLATHLAALRSHRSRSVGDLRDFEALARWLGDRGGDLLTALPLLPTFNTPPAEPSPYAPVSRLFWSELVLDLGEAHRPVARPGALDVVQADREVREALTHAPDPGPDGVDEELRRYADFRGAQARLGRNWRAWPEPARRGILASEQVDPAEARFHRVAQTTARRQLAELHGTLEGQGVRLGLDLAVGAHPDGYDTWSRNGIFAPATSVGAPPDPGFPSGQDWGFPPVDPDASRREGHAYFAASVAHQARWSGVLRVDHVMALTRLYWIPHGFSLDRGTYVSYPTEELFAVLCLESHRHACEVVGENLGTVPPNIEEALPRHGIRGMYLALFSASGKRPRPPLPSEVAMVGTHDTPTFAGWVEGADIGERVRCGLLDPAEEEGERTARRAAVRRLADWLGEDPDDVAGLLEALLTRLGGSEAPRVVPWLEDLWLEAEGVNLPGTRSSERPNWQRPMRPLLDELFEDPDILRRVALLDRARRNGGSTPARGEAGPQDPPDPRAQTR